MLIKTLVFGHLSPDTDSVCVPIVYAWFLKQAKTTLAQAFVLGNLNKETEFLLKKFNVEKPKLLKSIGEMDKVIILDTNNPEELPKRISETNIIEIIDHHKLVGGLTTPAPITLTIKPVAATATLVWEKIKPTVGQDIPKNMAALLLAAILSDTLKFTSPTTTDEDEKAARELAKISEQDIDKLANQMFAAKSDLSGLSPKDILLTDSKLFEMGKNKVRISVLETTIPGSALNLKSELTEKMNTVIKQQNLDYLFFFIVDILKSESTLLTTEEGREVAQKAFGKKFVGDTLHLPGIVSRKKQMIPALEKALT